MQKELLPFTKMQQIQSVYTYMLPHTTVPLLIVKSWADLPHLMAHQHALQGIVVLTPNDIQHGVDAFALTYVHMHARSSLEYWDEVFANLIYQRDQVINHMELLLRSTLIDLREMMVLDRATTPLFTQQLILCLDRILCGWRYVKNMAIEPMDLLALTDLVDGEWDIDTKWLITLLRTQVSKHQISRIYDNLLALLDKIDTLK